MAVPVIIEDVTFRAGRGRVFAYDDRGHLIGQVTSIEEGIHVRLMGRKHRGWLASGGYEDTVREAIEDTSLDDEPTSSD